MEEEDAEAYGFGSFSELFDDRSQAAEAPSTKPLDVAAIQRFWMAETALQGFLEAAPSGFEHVAVKFDGVAVDGGLGSVYFAHEHVAAGASSGIVWIQTQRSDSNAQEKRRKQLKRLSAGADSEDTVLSSAALIFNKQEMQEIRATTIQNTVLGINIELQDGHHVELAFMPGPFANPKHRDELLNILTRQSEPSHGLSTPKTPSKALPSPVQSKESAPQTKSPDRPTPSRTRTDVRALIRKYLSLAPASEEAMELAKYVYDKTGYHLGPMTKTAPRFAGDAVYRKKSMDELSAMLDRMNRDWKQADIDRESHTKTRYKRDDDDFFHYTDAETGEGISPHEYEQRYMRYLRPEPVDPILRLSVSKTSSSIGESSAHRRQEADSKGRKTSIDAVAAMLGFDISKSCLADHEFIQAVRTGALCHRTPVWFDLIANEASAVLIELDSRLTSSSAPESAECARVRQETRDTFRRHWDVVFPPIYQEKAGLEDAQLGGDLLESSSSLKAEEELKHSASTDHDAALPSTDTSSVAAVEENIATRTKRRRSSQGTGSIESTTVATRATTRRKTRRQSIVGVVHFPSTPELSAPNSSSKGKEDTPSSSRRSPRRPLLQETSDVCQLCCADSAVVLMEPCGHSVCESCWRRLAHAREDGADRSEAQCPWDRESVTRQSN